MDWNLGQQQDTEEEKSSPKSLSADCRYTVSQLLTNSKPTLKKLRSVLTSPSLDPYCSIRISRIIYHKLG